VAASLPFGLPLKWQYGSRQLRASRKSFHESAIIVDRLGMPTSMLHKERYFNFLIELRPALPVRLRYPVVAFLTEDNEIVLISHTAFRMRQHMVYVKSKINIIAGRTPADSAAIFISGKH
jgi:hypothetical protein